MKTSLRIAVACSAISLILAGSMAVETDMSSMETIGVFLGFNSFLTVLVYFVYSSYLKVKKLMNSNYKYKGGK